MKTPGQVEVIRRIPDVLEVKLEGNKCRYGSLKVDDGCFFAKHLFRQPYTVNFHFPFPIPTAFALPKTCY